LPFCHVHLKGPRPLHRAYPQVLVTIGDHLRKRRFDFGLRQRDVAEALGASSLTVTNWERNRTAPALRFLPRILGYLGYLPLPPGNSVGQQLTAARKVRGLSRAAAARILGVDPATLWRWECGQRRPGGAFLAQIETFLHMEGK
jgi:transcriptional regulator with XRE-family HTH domain